jgi:hypothetical protein
MYFRDVLNKKAEMPEDNEKQRHNERDEHYTDSGGEFDVAIIQITEQCCEYNQNRDDIK